MNKCLLIIIVLFSLVCFSSCAELQDYQEIVSIKQSSTISGSFFLGTGSIDSTNYYYFYFRDNEGYQLGEQPTENTVIIEDDGIIPHIERVADTWWHKSTFTKKYGISAKIYVPKGTILMEFNLK